MNSKNTAIIIIILIILISGGFFVYLYFFSEEKTKKTVNTETKELNVNKSLVNLEGRPMATSLVKLDPDKVATHLSKVENTPNAYWWRGYGILWNDVEKKKGIFDWSMIDQGFEKFSKDETYLVGMIEPFANWDQDTCHLEKKYQTEYDPKRGGAIKKGKPCDMEAYKNFLEKAVERYDGDGENDMPGLKFPIKYWEIINEPSMQGGVEGGMGEDLKFFVGSSQDYFDILKTSYEAIKKVDPEAKVTHAGMAGMHNNFVEFWEPVFAAGAGNYFDIANMHSISTDENTEDLYIIRFKKLLEKYGIKDKPIWNTEVQFGSLTKKPIDLEEFANLMVRATVFSFVQGYDKLFYIENWMAWDNDYDRTGQEKIQSVYQNIVDKINVFDRIVTIKEEYIESKNDYEGARTSAGQYKFINNGKEVYVLWGSGSVPSEITGSVKVTDVWGNESIKNASEIVLTDLPIFVEKM